MAEPERTEAATVIRSRREFCAQFFPRAHAEKRCRCYPQPGVLVILPRPGR